MEDSDEEPTNAEPAKEDPAEEETDENNPRSKAEPTVTFDLVDLPPVSPLRNSPPLKPSQNLLEESLNEIDDVADCFGDPIPAGAEEATPEHPEAEVKQLLKIQPTVFPWCTGTDLDNFLSPGVPMSTMSSSLN